MNKIIRTYLLIMPLNLFNYILSTNIVDKIPLFLTIRYKRNYYAQGIYYTSLYFYIILLLLVTKDFVLFGILVI